MRFFMNKRGNLFRVDEDVAYYAEVNGLNKKPLLLIRPAAAVSLKPRPTIIMQSLSSTTLHYSIIISTHQAYYAKIATLRCVWGRGACVCVGAFKLCISDRVMHAFKRGRDAVYMYEKNPRGRNTSKSCTQFIGLSRCYQ